MNSVKADGTVSSLKCEESDAEISFVTDDAPFYVLGTKTPESSSDISPDSTGKKMIAYKTVHRQQFKM